MGATITLYDTTPRHSSAAGHATTDAHGRYHIRDAVVPVQTSFNGHAFGKEMTPYAGFILSGLAPGLGVSWSRSQSMYSVNPPHPDDIQGRLPLGEPIALDLTFPRPAFLKGSIVDEHGDPVAGAKLQVSDCDLLDSEGRETNNRQGYDWKVLPDRVGRAVTDGNGRFRIEGLADRACYLLFVQRPETENTGTSFYAATIDGPDTVHEQLPAGSFNGRGRHDVKTGDLTITFPKLRLITVTVVGDDTGKPVSGAPSLFVQRVAWSRTRLWRTDRCRGQSCSRTSARALCRHQVRPAQGVSLSPDQPAPTGRRERRGCPKLRDPPGCGSRIDYRGGRSSSGQSGRRRLLLESPSRPARGDTEHRNINDLVERALDQREGRNAGRAAGRAGPALPLPFRGYSRAEQARGHHCGWGK